MFSLSIIVTYIEREVLPQGKKLGSVRREGVVHPGIGGNMDLQNPSQHSSWWTSSIGAATLALVALFVFQSTAQAQASFASTSDDAPLTYSADVASIIQETARSATAWGESGPWSS